jgi:hypothetical protein
MTRLALLLIPLAGAVLYLLLPGPSGISGIVRDEAGPVGGALVRVKGAAHAVRTDVEGRFRLNGKVGPGDRITAWKEGYFIAGIPVDSSPLVLTLHHLPHADNEEYAWTDPTPDLARRENCGNCHGAIFDEWRQSGHARASTNRRFRNLYEGTDWYGRPAVGWSLYHEYPNGLGVCTACHAPGVGLSDPANYELTSVSGVDRHGVHCDYCHKVANVETQGRLGITHGRFGLQLLRPTEGQMFFGPLPDVDRGEDGYSRLYRNSRYCASCHEGIVFGVHVYSTYSEWLQSPARAAGKHCQDCHMAPTGKLDNIAPGRGGIRRDPQTLANHTMFAGSQEQMLRRALRLTPAIVAEPAGVRVAVEIEAQDVGHRVPTGFIDRNITLVVEALADGKPVGLLDGPTLPTLTGRDFVRRPGLLFAKQLCDPLSKRPVPFWRAKTIPVDTRLVPGTPERAVFRFPPHADRVRIRLLYRRFWPEVVETKRWPDDTIAIIDREWAIRGNDQ